MRLSVQCFLQPGGAKVNGKQDGKPPCPLRYIGGIIEEREIPPRVDRGIILEMAWNTYDSLESFLGQSFFGFGFLHYWLIVLIPCRQYLKLTELTLEPPNSPNVK